MDNNKQDVDRARKDFLGEAEELLDEISLNLSELEDHLKSGKQKPDTINAIFRSIHSLKGLSGMLGYTKITQLTHDLENLLDEIRMGKISITTIILDFLYDCIDTIIGLTNEISEKKEKNVIDIKPILSRIEEFMADKTTEEKSSILDQIEIDPNIIKVLTEYEEYRLTDNIEKRVNIFSILANFNFDSFDEELTTLNSHLRDIGEIITTLPSIEPISDTDIQFNLIIGTDKNQRWLESEFNKYNITIKKMEYKDHTLENAILEASTPELFDDQDSEFDQPPIDQEEIPSDKKVNVVGKTVRVNLEKIDDVLHLIGELAITKTMMTTIAQELRDQYGFYRANELLKTTRTLEKQILRLQSRVLETRMIPLEHLFSRLSRNTKKIARETKKKIDIVIKGEETELDKMLVEELSDPLLHILRNAIDHGIEDPLSRQNAGKDETGKITISAFQRGNYVIIEIIDDGKGLDIELIKKKARQSGILPTEKLSDEEIQQLIFLPGFSTRDSASEISGRGVGMDIVRKNISSMNGTIKIKSIPEEGTQFIISIPITMAILPALLVDVAEEKYAIPLTSISKSLKLITSEIQTIEDREVLEYQGNAIPMLRLRSFFNVRNGTGDVIKGSEFAVIVHSAERVIALVVDRLIGRQDIVIKSLGKRFQNFPGIAGGTETGDEKVILVLDIASLISYFREELTLH